LVDGYARYRAIAGENAWKLVLLGDGELRSSLEAFSVHAGLKGELLMPGFRQYNELPAWYGLANCFVHASTIEQWGLVVNEAMAAGLPVILSDRCGCAADLVHHGENGFQFDPYDVDQLGELMFRVAHTDLDLQRMGESSRSIIAEWGPDRFAQGLASAVNAALAAPRPRPSWADEALLWSLARIAPINKV
jgi:glycosyltransferase involved in cell wall biosynthesis